MSMRFVRLPLAGLLLALAGVVHASEPVVFKHVAQSVEDRAEANQPVEALILIDDSSELAAEAQAWAQSPPLRELDAEQYDLRLKDRSRRLGGLRQQVASEVADPDLDILREFEDFPILHVRLKSGWALDALKDHPKVLSIDEVTTLRPNLAQSLPLVQQPIVAADGWVGTGTSIAILDTGVDYTNPAFGFCTAPNTPSNTCKVVFAADFGVNDGQLDDSGHGTVVAATALGVAPGAKIIALDVFRGFNVATDVDVIAGLQWVLANRNAYNIAAVNMSLGGGRFYSPIPATDAWGTAIQRVIDAGIVVVAASGNAGYKDSLNIPAAYANVVSVGAVYDAANLPDMICSDPVKYADLVACWSNSADFLSILAPGSAITAGGRTASGTSLAAPHVAGAASVMRQVFPADTAGQIGVRLQAGPLTMDPRNGLFAPRLSLLDSIITWDQSILETRVGGGGTVTPGAGVYAPGEQLALTATPDFGFVFAGWKGACVGLSPQCAVTMNGNKSVEATFNVVPTAIPFGQTVGGLRGRVGEGRFYYVDVPAGIPELSIRTRGGAGDVDLYVRRGAAPSLQQFDCRQILAGNAERCTLPNPPAGRYHIMLYAFSGYSGVSLSARDGTLSDQELEFSQAAYSIVESGGSITLPVVRVEGSDGTVSVQYGTVDGSAVANEDYVPRSGTLTFEPGVTVRNIVIPILNDSMVEGNEAFSVVLFAPVNVGLGVYPATSVMIIDDDSNIEFETSNIAVSEETGGVEIVVRRVGGLGGGATVNFKTVGGTAKPKSDFVATKGVLSFAPGEGMKTIFVPIINDNIAESDETFQVVLANAKGATLGAQTVVQVTILNDDHAEFGFESAEVVVVENARFVNVNVLRSGAIGGPASVAFSTSDGTAVAGPDYAARSGVLKFKANAAVATIRINITNDNVLEETEFFQVHLHDPVGATLGAASTTVMILDDDSRFDLELAEVTVSEGDAMAVVPVRRVGNLHTQASVRVRTANGTALAKQDYLVTSVTLTFMPGVEVVPVFIPIVENTLPEPTEYFFVQLSGPKGASLGNASTTVFILDND